MADVLLARATGLEGFARHVVIKCIRSGEPAPQKPWEGADSLEWTHLPTPVPYHTFETAPVIK